MWNKFHIFFFSFNSEQIFWIAEEEIWYEWFSYTDKLVLFQVSKMNIIHNHLLEYGEVILPKSCHHVEKFLKIAAVVSPTIKNCSDAIPYTAYISK